MSAQEKGKTMRPHLKRALVVFALGVAAAAYFWLFSRYPDLDAKAAMGGDGAVGDVLSVWPLLEVKPEFSLLKKILFSTVNWAWDNKKGMAFGVFLGSVALTILGYVRLPEFRSRLGGALLGFFVGTPLGVCVNCAAPIMKGVLKSRRVETAFAAMISSPTMNIVVLTMVFSLFPFYMACIKVLFALVGVFVFVPILSRLIGPERVRDLQKIHDDGELSCDLPPHDESWPLSIKGALRDLAGSLWYMTRKTVPLMLLAGALGSSLSYLIPLGALDRDLGFLGVVCASLVGLVLPCPIAFDVLLSNALWRQGLPEDLTLVLLCTLGIYSIYPFLLTWTSASKEWALGLLACFFGLAVVVGAAGETLHRKLYVEPSIARFHALSEASSDVAIHKGKALITKVTSPKAPVAWSTVVERDRVLVEKSALEPTKIGDRFTKLEGFQIGLGRGFRYGIRDYPDPFWIGRGTASGDFDDDGWTDIAFGSDTGPLIYRNRGGVFEPVPVDNEKLLTLRVYAVAFVDLNGDGWLDLFFSTFAKGNFVVPSQRGRFDFHRLYRLPSTGEVLTVAPAFGDVDGDGRVDIVLGNMALGVITGSHRFADDDGWHRENVVLLNRAEGFVAQRLPGASGESMSTLLSDVDDDGWLDLFVANDFIVPDVFYKGGEGGFTAARATDVAPVFSMGADTGDIDGDGVLDLALTGTIRRKRGRADIDGVPYETYSKPKWGREVCAGIKDKYARQNCELVRREDDLGPLKKGGSLDVTRCSSLPVRDRQACLLASMWALVTHNDVTDDCRASFAGDRALTEVCEILQRKGDRYAKSDFPGSVRQVDDSHLFIGDGRGSFSAIDHGLFMHPGGWTWGARFCDLDNDGRLDLFNADGTVRKSDFGWNVFFRNTGERFEQRQFSLGLTDDFSLFSFAIVDFDRDGDLDIIGNGSTGPIQVYRNDIAARPALSISLFDQASDNRFGIGAKVSVVSAGKRHVRELKLSGGYQSLDAPIAHFGGLKEPVDFIEVSWPDRTRLRVDGPFASFGHLRLTRR